MEDRGNTLQQEGFAIYRANKVKRLSPTQFLVKTEAGIGSFLVELRNGQWNCDCDLGLDDCQHRYAARLSANVARLVPDETEESKLKCRYCGSLDVSRCGFRYNAYGISRRYRCNECQRKFSIKYSDGSYSGRVPSESIWLLSEIGMILTKLEDLIERAGSSLSQSK